MGNMLVTGGSGFLGKRIQARYNAVAPCHGEMDITNMESCLIAFDRYKPQTVIHCAAISDTAYCAKHPEEGFLINVLGAENIARACTQFGTKLIFASSDQVYSGGDAPHSENEKVVPAGPYGEMKREAEKRILELLSDAVCLRLSWMYDVPQPERPSFLSQLKGNSIMKLSDKEYRGITWVMEVVEQIEKIALLPGGIYNAGSPNQYTTYETGCKVVQHLKSNNLAAAELEKGDWFRNLAMDISKIEKYGIQFSNTVDRLLKLA